MVFDFIREDIAGEIVTAQVQKIRTNLAVEKGITLTLSDRAMQELKSKASGNLENGGRGIGNIVESCLINPLACHLFDNNISAGGSITIDDIRSTENGYALICNGGGEPGTGISARSEGSVSSSEPGSVSGVRQQNPDHGIFGGSEEIRSRNDNHPSVSETAYVVPERTEIKSVSAPEQNQPISDVPGSKPDPVIDSSFSDRDVSGSAREQEPQSLSFSDIFGGLFSDDDNKDQKKKEKKSIDDFLKGD